MPNFTPEQVHDIMAKPRAIRNVTVCANVDAGKSTLTDALVQKAGFISEKDAGTKRYTDGRADEIERGITIKSVGVTMYFEVQQKVKEMYKLPEDTPMEHLINLVDSPGHVDFSSEVTAALRVSDGSIVLCDTVEGISVQTETVFRQSLFERVRPVFGINKIDRLFFELKLTPEEMYKKFNENIEAANAVLKTYLNTAAMGEMSFDATIGNVIFCSAYQQWGFTINEFAYMYAKKMNTDIARMRERLFGEWYYDPEGKKWIQSEISDSGKKLDRGFCQFIIKPIQQIVNLSMADKKDELVKLMEKLDVKLTSEDLQLSQKKLFGRVMHRWLPLADSLLGVFVAHLPSPVTAQKYRVENLYDGDLADECAEAIRNCDPNGPVMVYISKMVPTKDNSRFQAFGRIFSGTIRTGMKVRILSPEYDPAKGNDQKGKNIQSVAVMMGRTMQTMEDVPCGNTVVLGGIDQFMVKTGTITTSLTGNKIKDMKLAVSAVVRVSVEPKNSADLPSLVEGMKRLKKSDPLVEVVIDQDTGEYIVAGAGELHLEISINDLKDFCRGAEIIVGEPVVPYRETVTKESSIVCLSKSPNKHNRLFVKAEPLSTELVTDIDNKEFDPNGEEKARAKALSEKYGWEAIAPKKVWAFGPEGTPTNIYVDMTKGVQYLNEIQESVCSGFLGATKRGVLCDEPMRGVRFNLLDVALHADSIHRGGGQIIPTSRSVCFAAFLAAEPRLMEPIYLVEIVVPLDGKSGVYTTLNKRRGTIISDENQDGTPLYTMRAHLPVAESFGFTAALREETSGKAFPQCTFSHWEVIDEDPFDPKSKVHAIVKAVRKRKGMKEEPIDRALRERGRRVEEGTEG